MNKDQELAVKFVEVLGKQNPTAEEKKLKALIKQALLADNPMAFIDEVYGAFNGCGKVKMDTVKGVVEYFKAHNEVQIRNTDCPDEQKDEMAKREADRLTEVEVWILGCLAYWGMLEVD